MRLVCTEIHATYSARGAFGLPYHSGGMFHGLFGRALRKVVCAEVPCCAGACARAGACDWERLFAPPPRLPAPHRLLVGMKEPPGPVVLLVPPPGRADLSPGSTMSVGLRLFGETRAEDVARLEKTLEAMADLPIGGDEGRVALRAVTRYSPRDVAPGAEGASEGLVGAGVGAEATAGAADPKATRVRVRFETPLRIKKGGQVAEDIDFAKLLSQVWRRLTLLSALYGEYGEADDAVFQQLRENAARVRTAEKRLTMLKWEHLSAETHERKPMCGLLGHVAFEGEGLRGLLPALVAGEAVHVGGGTSFGLGRMKVEV